MSKADPKERTVAGANSALDAAGIPVARRGQERTRRLSAAEGDLYRWILERFADAQPPRPDKLHEAAVERGLDRSQALRALAREDLVHSDDSGEIIVAYPFSAHSRGHRVEIDGQRSVEAMCAVDALGIGPMLDLPVVVSSRDPLSGGEIHVEVSPDRPITWEPEGAVVLAGSASCDGPSFRGCCDVLNFFETAENAERYLREHAEIRGTPIAIPEAVEAGRVVFGDLLHDA
jgi:hypothetical protein